MLDEAEDEIASKYGIKNVIITGPNNSWNLGQAYRVEFRQDIRTRLQRSSATGKKVLEWDYYATEIKHQFPVRNLDSVWKEIESRARAFVGASDSYSKACSIDIEDC